MDQGARFPKVAAKGGHYESFYIKACRPGGGQGLWIRHTVHKRPGAVRALQHRALRNLAKDVSDQGVTE